MAYGPDTDWNWQTLLTAPLQCLPAESLWPQSVIEGKLTPDQDHPPPNQNWKGWMNFMKSRIKKKAQPSQLGKPSPEEKCQAPGCLHPGTHLQSVSPDHLVPKCHACSKPIHVSCRITGYWYRWSHHTSVYCCEECKEEDTSFRLGKHREYTITVGQPHPSNPPWRQRLEAVTEDELHATLMIYCFYHPRAQRREDIGDILHRCLEARHRMKRQGNRRSSRRMGGFQSIPALGHS